MRIAAAPFLLVLAACAAPRAPAAAPAAASRAPSGKQPAPPPDPHIHFAWPMTRLDRDSAWKMGTARVSITTPAGATTFECTRDFAAAMKLPPAEQPCREAARWMREPGTYRLHISLFPRWKVSLPDLDHTFQAEGSEIGFSATVQLDVKSAPPFDPFVQQFRFGRVEVTPPER